jgi:hypothetical protein
MRPRKSVLLYCADDDHRMELAFLLKNHGYSVLGGISDYPPVPRVALVIEDRTLATAVAANAIADLLPEVPLLVLLAPGRKVMPPGYPGNAQIIVNEESGIVHATLLWRIYVAAKRKTGPKKPHSGSFKKAEPVCA